MSERKSSRLPPLVQVSVAVLGLSSRAHQLLAKSGFTTVAQLLRPTHANREALRLYSTPADLREISQKLRHFYRCYLAVKKILTVASQSENVEEASSSPIVLQKTMANYDHINIDVLNLPESTYNALRRYGITHVGSLLTMRRKEIAAIPYVNERAAEEIDNALASFLGEEGDGQSAILAETKRPYGYDAPISKLEMSRSMRRALEGAGIKTVFDLVQRSDAELAAIKYVGTWRVAGVRSAVEEFMWLREVVSSNAHAEAVIAEAKSMYEVGPPTAQDEISVDPDTASAIQQPSPEIPRDYHQIPLGVLDLSTRPYRALRRARIKTVGDLLMLETRKIAAIENIGPLSMKEIDTKLADYLQRPLEDARKQAVSGREPVRARIADVSEAHLQAPLAALNLKIRARNALHIADVKTVRELMLLPKAKLADIYGLGDVMLTDIENKLETFLAKPVPNEVAKLLWASLSNIGLPELLDAWFHLHLDSRERRVVEQRYGLFKEEQSLEMVGRHLGVSSAAIRRIQVRALGKLQMDLRPIESLFKLVRTELAANQGVLPIIVWSARLQKQHFSLGTVRPEGLLNLLADLEEVWFFYDLGQGVLFEGVATRAKAEAKLARWHRIHGPAQSVAASTTVPPNSVIPISFEGQLPEILDQWFTMFLTSRQREIVEHRYGLHGEPQTLEKLGSQFDVTRERIRQIQKAALEQLQTDLRPITPLLELARSELARTGGVLPLEIWIDFLDGQSFSLGTFRALGLLELLADFEESWNAYAIGQGVLFEGVSTRAEAEEKLADWQRSREADEKTRSSGLASTTRAEEEDHGDTEATTNIEFARDLKTVLHNVRQWNIDLETRAGKEAWGQRTVTYFVYDRRSDSFAPSKFCAYAPAGGAQRRIPWLTVAVYARIDREDPIFDGQRARLHLTDTLDFISATPKQGTALRRSFDVWAQGHVDSVTVHPRGPQLLLPKAVLVSSQDRLQIRQPSLEWQSSLAESKPRPQTRKITEADLASTQAQRVPAEGKVAADSPFYAIEMELREQLEKVDFIGELAVEEEQFRRWCELVKTHALEDGRFQPRMIPPAAFVTQMVFAARYSAEEARNFWQPYAHMVWGQEEASAYFQLRCRNRFKQAIAFLSKQYDLIFPQRSAGDLVRPIYRHAIIPAYLEREFVDWLKRNWREILETPEGFLIPQLRQERSLNHLSPTLRNFIQGADTAETAAALIRNMATAAGLHAEGEALADIHDLLTDSPIEQSLWDELSNVYVEQADASERRRLSHRLEWLWNMEAGEMQLRLRNLYLPGTMQPYQIVWVDENLPAEEAALADVYAMLDPWEVEGDWLIDEAIFAPDGPLNGVLMVLGDDDNLLWQQQVPRLPEMGAQFFRLTQQEVYAVPVAPDNVQPGRYLVALKTGVRLVGAANEDLEATRTLSLPYLLHERFETCGFYEINLPLTILEQDAELDSLTSSGVTSSSEPPYIYGKDAVSGLSRRVPPLFGSDAIWLVIPGANERLLAQSIVELRPQKGKVQRRLLKEMEVEVDETGAFWVPLRELMGRMASGTYTIELRRGLRSLLQAPLQFSCIPGFEAIAPPRRPLDAPIYTPSQAPVVRLRGIGADQIGNRERLRVTTDAHDWIEVSWHDLRGGCRLPLSVNNQQVPLEWPVSRFFAWVEPAKEGNVFTWETLKGATLQAVGAKGVDYFFISVGNNGQKRRLSLNRHGRTRIAIRQDQLYDMLRHADGAEVNVYASVFSERWPLFTLRRQPELHDIRVKHDSAVNMLVFESGLEKSWPGNYQFQIQQLSNPSATPRILQNVRQLEARHDIPCELTDGIYQFEVWDPGAQQALAKEIFGVGEVERSAFFDEAVRLLESLSRDTARRLPRWLGGDMIRFLAAETERTDEGKADLASEWLWQLALLQPRAYASATDDELQALWSPLLRFRQVANVDAWEQAYGLLPDWAVMPFQLALRVVLFGNSITVEPEVLSRKGQHGIGHCLLKMGEEHRHVYVTWEPHSGARVRVTLGLPEKAPNEVDYVQLDALDMFPVYQCQQCGWFVASNIAEEVREKHHHRRAKPHLEDVLNHPGDYRLLAEVTPTRREDIRDYRLSPDYFVDRRRVLALLQDAKTNAPDPHQNLHPLGRAAYLYASSCWVARYRQDSKAAQALQEIIGDTKRRKSFDRLTVYLSESRWFDVGSWGAMGRFLAAFPWERDEPLVNIDRYALLLALLVRTRVHARLRTAQLRKELGLRATELAEMLRVLNRYCPELVDWAFCWVELFFVHAAG